jgi:hypothetical protein
VGGEGGGGAGWRERIYSPREGGVEHAHLGPAEQPPMNDSIRPLSALGSGSSHSQVLPMAAGPRFQRWGQSELYFKAHLMISNFFLLQIK